MTRKRQPSPDGATAAQLRDDIDSGRASDKIGGFDPAAAPLGTDDEAGGVAHDPMLMAATRVRETGARAGSATRNAATPELQPDGVPPRTGRAIPILLGVLAAAILALLLLAVL